MNEYSIVIVEFEVEFADAETQLSYDHYVDDLKSMALTKMILLPIQHLKLVKNGILTEGYCMVKISTQSYIGSRFILKSLLTIMNLPHVKVIVFRSALEINVD